MKIKSNYKIIYKIKYEIAYIQRNQVASFHEQNSTKNTHGRAKFHTPLVKSNQPVSQQMEHWSWLKCVNITCTGNIILAQLAITVYWLPCSNIVFESFNVMSISIFYVIIYHVPNFCSHVSKKTDFKIFRIYIWPKKSQSETLSYNWQVLIGQYHSLL